MNFGGLLGAVSRVLPGYVEGQRQAVRDNWQDLMNYNQVQQGQLANAFTEATWQPRLDMFYDQSLISALNAMGSGIDFTTKAYYAPYQWTAAQAYSQLAPWLAPQAPYMQWQANNMRLQKPWAMMRSAAPNGANATTPSGVR